MQGGGVLSWLIFSIRAPYHGSGIEQLQKTSSDLSGIFPKLSVIITARNEEWMMEKDLESLLCVDYPEIEFIVINDRSIDRTGKIIDSFAAKDLRIKAIHIETLPQGWLGKVNALHIGVSHANGSWLLFSDADIRFEKDILKQAVGFAERNGCDHLSLLPDDRSLSQKFFVPLFILAFGMMFVTRTKARSIGKQGSDSFVGVGAFNLVRRSAFERTPGFEWLKMEVIDDVGLGLMLSRSGARSAVLSGTGLLSFEWYRTLQEAIVGLKKNAFAGFAGYDYFRGILLVLGMWAITILPIIIAVGLQSWLFLFILIFLYFILPGIYGKAMQRVTNIRPILVSFLPLGYVFVSVALLNSMISVWREKGISWRDTFYPLDELRKGGRVKL